MCKQQQKVHFKKAFKIKPSKRKNQADCANYSTEWATYTRVSLYLLFKLFHVLILRETIISTCSCESFFSQSGNNKNTSKNDNVLTVS